MLTISKGTEPNTLSQWKRQNPNGHYKDLPALVRQSIRHACTTEQFYLCAYCCAEITGDNQSCHNEHVEAQSGSAHRTLDHQNIVASCETPKQCDKAHGHQPLPLTPLMDECETEFKFYLSGRIEGLTERAQQSVEILNLGDNHNNNRDIIETRKQFIDNLMYCNGVDPSQGLEDEDLIRIVLDEISQPTTGKLEPFTPAVINILQQWLEI